MSRVGEHKTMHAVIGTGTWGTAMAQLIARQQIPVQLWGRRAALTSTLQQTRHHEALPDVHLHPDIAVNSDPSCLAECDTWLWAVPTQHTAAIAQQLAESGLRPGMVTSLSKGIEITTGRYVSSILQTAFPEAIVACLSGPSHAEEIMHGKPAGLVAAGPSAVTNTLVELLHHKNLRVYRSHDLAGVELAGALKNVIAIAAGMCDGLQLGDNTKALLITRGIAEMQRLAAHLGAEAKTMAGLAGIGDLMTTCYSPYGRNLSLGRHLAAGGGVAEWEQQRGAIAEGAWTSQAIAKFYNKDTYDLPICSGIDQICWHGASVQEAMKELLSRGPREE
jgi:glycerol-3-phosphate dehydrogenase (NAD(P)+)